MTVLYANSDPATNIVLDFIAGGVPGNPSGESMGNYDAVIGDAHSTAPLWDKTLTDIYQLMTQLRAMGRPSTATGRYQIVRATLQSRQEALESPDDQHFTPEYQDELGYSLLTIRGWSAWRDGDIDDATLAHNLSLEWASLPDPLNGGASHYDGFNQNHASTTLAKVYAMLDDAREALHIPPTPPPDWTKGVDAAKNLQQVLKDLGLYKGAIDGIIGEGSQAAAIACFRRDQDIR